MKKFRVFYLFIWITIIFCPELIAQKSFNINNVTIPKSQIQTKAQSLLVNTEFDGIERMRPFFYNPNLRSLTLRNRGDILQLDFFDDKKYDAIIERITTYPDGITAIMARLKDFNYAYCFISISPQGIAIDAEIPELDEQYFVGAINGETYLSQFKKSKIDAQTLDCEEEIFHEGRMTETDMSRWGTPCTNASLDANVTIDVMMVYTPAAKKWAQNNATANGIDNVIAIAMEKSNLVMMNSKTGVTLRLVHKHETDYIETNTATDLSRFRVSDDGYMDEVYSLRRQYNVDLMVFLGNLSFTGGLAGVLNTSKGNPGWASTSLVRVQQASTSYSVVHEMGHNLGLGHGKTQSTQASTGLYQYSGGWRGVDNTGKRISTVMAYTKGSDGLNYPDIPYFSSPDIIVSGVRIGDTNEANSALTIRRTKCITSRYSDFYGQSSDNQQPSVSISNLSEGATVSINNISVSANASDPDGIISKVEFYLNGVLKHTSTSSPYTATIGTLNLGTNSISVKAIDDKGASAAASVNITYALSGSGGNDCGGVAAWSEVKEYVGGDKVHYGGYIYEASYWSKGARPDLNYGTYGKPWKGTRTPCVVEPENIDPIVYITSPVDDSVVNTSSVTVNATATDADGTISKVEFYLNGVLKTTDTSSPYSASVGTLNVGSNLIKVVAYDNKNAKKETSINIVYSTSTENVKPTVTIIDPINGAIISNPSVNVSATAFDPDGSISKVEFYLNGELKNTDTTDPYTAFSVGILRRGTNTIVAKAYDNKGATAEYSINITQGTADTQAPTSPGKPVITAVDATTASVTFSNSTDNIAVAGYEIMNTKTSTILSTTDLAITDLTDLTPNTEYTIAVRAFDVAGNRSPLSPATTFKTTQPGADTQAPTKVLNIKSLGNTQTSIDLGWDPSTDNVAVKEYKVFDGSLNRYIATSVTNRCLIPELTPNTTYLFYVRAYDEVGNSSEKSDIYTTQTLSLEKPNIPPVISISSPANGATVSTTTVSLSASASDNDGSISKVEFYLNGVLKSTVNSAPYNATIGTLIPGSNRIVATAYDNKGDVSEAIININYSVANVPPTVFITSPANGSTVNTSTVGVRFNANDTDGNISKIEIYLNNALKTTLTTSTPEVSIGTLMSGTNTIMVKAYDNKGASTTSSVTLTYKSATDDCMGVTAWSSSKVYNAGDKVRDGDVIYKADFWTQGNRPSQNFGSGKPWSVVSKCDGSTDTDAFGETQICDGINILIWKKDNVYDKPGTKVVYEGKIYQCKYWTQGNIPSNGGAWSLIGLCK